VPDPGWRFGLEIDRGYDADGCRHKEACLGLTRCPACGKTLFLIAATGSWTEGEGGRWEHYEYGPAEAICCGRLVVDSWDGCYVYRLAEEEPHV
jgi:hypothetical protein